MEECCKVAQCKVFIGIFKARLFSIFSSELRKIPIKLGTKYKASDSENHNFIKTNVSDTALITFTTGSTGTPKAAKRTHGFLHEQFKALLEKINPQPEDIDMPVLPIVLLINLGAGCTSVISDFKASKPDLMNAKNITEQIVKHKVARLVSSPFFVKQLAKYVSDNKISIPLLQKIFTGGAPVFPAEAELYNNAFPKTQVEIVYGSTEAEPISSINIKDLIGEKDEFLQKGLNVGFPHRLAEVAIIKITNGSIFCSNDTELQKFILPKGEIGEIIVAGPHVLREYFNNENALKQNKIFIGEKCWHRTGDSGYMNNEGQIYLTGRCNSLIYLGNKIVAPFIYENHFQSLKGVEIGTVLQINNKLIAVLEIHKNSMIKEISEQIRNVEIQFDEIKFISKIPRDPRHNSKIDYEKLKNRV